MLAGSHSENNMPITQLKYARMLFGFMKKDNNIAIYFRSETFEGKSGAKEVVKVWGVSLVQLKKIDFYNAALKISRVTDKSSVEVRVRVICFKNDSNCLQEADINEIKKESDGHITLPKDMFCEETLPSEATFETIESTLNERFEKWMRAQPELNSARNQFQQIENDNLKTMFGGRSSTKKNKPKQLTNDVSQASDAEYQFEICLAELGNKVKDLRERNCHTAADEAENLYNKLSEKFESYKVDKNYADFKNTSTEAISRAKASELKNHRDCKWLLANIGLAILGLGVFYGVACVYNKWHSGSYLFFNKTDSIKKIEAIEAMINSDQLRTIT